MDSCLGCPARDRTLPAYYRFQYDRQKLARFSLLHLVSLRPQERPVDLKRYVIDGSRTSSISPWALIHWDAKQLAITCRSSVFLVHQWADHLRQPLAALAPAPAPSWGRRRPRDKLENAALRRPESLRRLTAGRGSIIIIHSAHDGMAWHSVTAVWSTPRGGSPLRPP
jgi:hypothetical protein